jgi:tRNA(Ile)-lysidine synthase
VLENIFRKTIKEYKLIEKRDRIILGVSGGPDSVSMLYQFLGIKKELKLHLVCAHFNHGLRKEADAEELFIKRLCVEVGISCISEKKEVEKFFAGDSLEQTARNLRFDFFLKCSRQTKIKKLSLAHHKDDLAETVLIRLVRGAGLRGLQGFSPKSKFASLTLIRPMIEMRKSEIIEWLKEKKVSYCLDASNFEDKFLRNRIRHKLLPLLMELNPNIIETLSNAARALSLDYDFIYSFSYEKFLSLKRGQSPNGLRLDMKGLKELPLSIFNNVIRIAIEELQGNIRKLEARHLDELRDLAIYRPEGSIVDLPNLLVKKEEKSLFIQSAPNRL